MSNDDDDDNITVVDFTGDPDGLPAAIDHLTRVMPDLKKYSELVAEYRMSQFNSYTSQGFTDQQALYLISKSQPFQG